MIRHRHPSATALLTHALGELSDGFALAVAAHISLCPHCQASYDQYEAHAFEQQLQCLVLDGEPSLDGNLNEMLQSILNERVHPELRDRRARLRSSRLQVNGEGFEVPWPLQRIAGRVRSWSQLGNNLHSASLSLESEAHRIGFLYIGQGSEIPPEVLKRHEFIMVLSGQLRDEYDDYGPGDFIPNRQVRTLPARTPARISCLCLTVLSAPLRLGNSLELQARPFFNQG